MSDNEITEDYHAVTCCKCYIKFWIPTFLYDTALTRGEHFQVWCPNGHSQYWDIVKPDDDDGGGEEAEIVRFPILTGGKK